MHFIHRFTRLAYEVMMSLVFLSLVKCVVDEIEPQGSAVSQPDRVRRQQLSSPCERGGDPQHVRH